MVKTLVFHTSNVGSIPPGLNMHKSLNLTALRTMTLPKESFTIRYSFRFTSLVPPLTISALNTTEPSAINLKSTRLLFKRSYLVLSWISYLARIGTQKRKHFRPTIAILPSRRTLYTLTKAPMAHKTNSKEQFMFKFYNFKFSFELLSYSSTIAPSVTQGAYVMRLTNRLFPVFETNLLSLKYYEITYPVRVTPFLNSTMF